MEFKSAPGMGNKDRAKTSNLDALRAVTDRAMNAKVEIENGAVKDISNMLVGFSSIRVDQPNMVDKDEFLAEIQRKVANAVEALFQARQEHRAAYDAEREAVQEAGQR